MHLLRKATTSTRATDVPTPFSAWPTPPEKRSRADSFFSTVSLYNADPDGDLETVARPALVRTKADRPPPAIGFTLPPLADLSSPLRIDTGWPRTPDGSPAHLTAQAIFDSPDRLFAPSPTAVSRVQTPVEWQSLPLENEGNAFSPNLYGAVDHPPRPSIDARSVRLRAPSSPSSLSVPAGRPADKRDGMLMTRAASESDLRLLSRATFSPVAVAVVDDAAPTAFVNPPLPAIPHLDLDARSPARASREGDVSDELSQLKAHEADIKRRFLDCRRQRNKCIKYLNAQTIISQGKAGRIAQALSAACNTGDLLAAEMLLLAHSIGILEATPLCTPTSSPSASSVASGVVDRSLDQLVLDELAREKLRRVEVEQEVGVLRLALALQQATKQPTSPFVPEAAAPDVTTATVDCLIARPSSVSSSGSSSVHDVRPFLLGGRTALLFDAFPAPPPSPPKPSAVSRSASKVLASPRRPRTAPSRIPPAAPPLVRSSALPYLVARPSLPPSSADFSSGLVAPKPALRPSTRDGRHPFARARALSPSIESGADARRP